MQLRSILTLAVATLVGCGDNLTHPVAHEPFGSGGGGGGSALSCVPNLDGVIDANELRAAFDVPVTYLVSPPAEKRTVDVAGKKDSMGALVWDFSLDFASDGAVELAATAVTGQWYASSFPTAEFAVPLDAKKTLDGVYRSDDAGFYLLGIASIAEKPKTLVVYDTPIPLFRFPLKPGTQWVAAANVANGTIDDLPYAGQDVYEIADDALGTLQLHDYTFKDVHRVRTKVTTSPAVGASVTRLQVGFLFECFGEVARATSQDGETNQNFTTAAEVRRLGQQ